jgi:hypothetical protein
MIVMTGLGPAIHDYWRELVDTRAKPGHDDIVRMTKQSKVATLYI